MIEYKDIIKKAPLPFAGQKRYALRSLYDYFIQHPFKDGDLIVDLFGGSGLLANLMKQMFPKCTVVWNDYDHYNDRLQMVDQTNRQIQAIRALVQDENLQNKEHISDKGKEKIIAYLKTQDKIDWLTIGSDLSFQMNLAESVEELQKKKTLYYSVPTCDYEVPEEYLNGVMIESADYKALIRKYSNAFFLIDPPYIQTLQTKYDGHFSSVRDLLELIEELKELKRYMIFTAQNGGMDDALRYFDVVNEENKIPFESAVRKGEVIYVC